MVKQAGSDVGRVAYQRQVPAVRRGLDALERLADASEPMSLTELSRSIGVAPSTLLAILTTLRGGGLVERQAADGRYRLGSGLVALAAAAERRLDVVRNFGDVADRLVAFLGESVLLWVGCDDGLVLAAVREGRHPLRFVPTAGLRVDGRAGPLNGLASSQPGQAVDGELQPGVWTVAVRLPTSCPTEVAVLALAGPEQRLRAAGPGARRALLAVVDGSYCANASAGVASSGWERSGPIGPAELDEFLGQGLVATLSYLADDGYPATVPLWYAWERDGAGRGTFWLVPRTGAEWARHARREPRVSLAVSESAPPLRRVLARGHVEAVDAAGDRWRQVETVLAGRYPGFAATRSPSNPRDSLLRLRPERLIAWRGLLRHPRTEQGLRPSEAGDRAWPSVRTDDSARSARADQAVEGST